MELISEAQKKVVLKLVKYVLKSEHDVDIKVKNSGLIDFYFRRNKEIVYYHYFYQNIADWEKEYNICMINVKHQIKLSKDLEKIK